MEQFRLAIIEDLEDIRDSLEVFFGKQEEIKELVAVGSMEAFFEKIRTGFVPDVVLTDIGLPGMSGIDGIEEIKFHFPEADIVMLTIFNDNDRIFKSLCSGAVGYALKGTPFPELKKAILEIRAGGSYMSPSIARKVVQRLTPVKVRKTEKLSPKEKIIIKKLTEGLSYKQIAEIERLSVDAVRFHIKNIYRKLHVHSRVEVMTKAFRGEI